jgi:transposase
MVQENAPERLIKSGLPTEAMVASVLVAKYGWHRVSRTHQPRWRCGAV